MIVYAYTRVSTDRQANEGLSLDVQERTVAGYAQMHGLTVDRTFVERGVSGSKPLNERPAGADLLQGLQAGDIIITPKLDRMFRSATDALHNLEQLKRAGVHLHMIDLGGDVTANGIAKLVFTILSAVAEAERDRIRERVATVKADQKARGKYLGGNVPFGWKVDSEGGLYEDADEQQALKTITAMHQGGASFRAISSALKDQGFTLSHEAVRKILARQKVDAKARG